MVKSLKLFQPKRTISPRNREKRGSRHERGYDSDWTRRADSYRAEFPLCAECQHHGRVIPADVVDHKIPVRDRPDLRLTKSNWWSLCHVCHNGIKARMETFARRSDMIDFLPMWCDDLSSRPPSLREAPARKKTPTMMI